jgi:membrane associated rhomboid family serine protease
LIPIGKESLLARFPWATVLLALVSTFLFFSTWSDQKAFTSVRWPDSPLVTEGKFLSALALEGDTRLPADLRSRLEDLRSSPYFPDEEADRILQSVQKNFDYLSALKRPDWESHFAAYAAARKDALDRKIPWTPVLDRYSFRSDDPLWPRLLTHLWIHAGLLHFLFCLYFLWMVGAHAEDQWGSIFTVVLYVGGGAASAAIVQRVLPGGDWVLVGASGAVAAMMGALLARHAGAPLRFFYALGVAFGVFSVPAWATLALWAPGVYAMGWLTDGRIDGPVSLWLHGAGFVVGVVAGWLTGLGHGSGGWSETSGGGAAMLSLRAEEAARLMTKGKVKEAQEIYQKILAEDAEHLPAMQGLLATHEFFQQDEEAAHLSVKVIRTALEIGQGKLAEEVFRKWSMRLFQVKLQPQERLVLAQNLELLQLWREALFASGKIWKEQYKKPEDAVPFFRQLLDPPYDLEWRPLAESELRALGKL